MMCKDKKRKLNLKLHGKAKKLYTKRLLNGYVSLKDTSLEIISDSQKVKTFIVRLFNSCITFVTSKKKYEMYTVYYQCVR